MKPEKIKGINSMNEEGPKINEKENCRRDAIKSKKINLDNTKINVGKENQYRET